MCGENKETCFAVPRLKRFAVLVSVQVCEFVVARCRCSARSLFGALSL